MTQGDAVGRGDLAEQLLATGLDIACALRGEDPDVVHTQLPAMDRLQLEQLAVVLAALVDVDQTVAQLLDWITWDEHGHPLPPDATAVAAVAVLAERRAEQERAEDATDDSSREQVRRNDVRPSRAVRSAAA